MSINTNSVTNMVLFNPLPMPGLSNNFQHSSAFTAAFHLVGIHVLYSFTSPRDPARNYRAMTQVSSWVEPFRLQICIKWSLQALKVTPTTFISYSDIQVGKKWKLPESRITRNLRRRPITKLHQSIQPPISHHIQRAMPSTPNQKSARHLSLRS